MAQVVEISENSVRENEFHNISISASARTASETMNSEVEGAGQSSAPKRARKNEGSIWKFFTKLSREEICCTLCNKKMKMTAESTSSLRRHMETYDKEVYSRNTVEMNARVPSMSMAVQYNNISLLDKNSPRAQELTNAIARMVVLDYQPFSLFKDKGFREFVQVAEPRYQIPTRTTFSDDIIPNMYMKEKKRLEQIINTDVTNLSKICIILLAIVISIT